jgi:hypothetical protein
MILVAVEGAMREAGFKNVIEVATDHRHRTVLGINESLN